VGEVGEARKAPPGEAVLMTLKKAGKKKPG